MDNEHQRSPKQAHIHRALAMPTNEEFDGTRSQTPAKQAGAQLPNRSGMPGVQQPHNFIVPIFGNQRERCLVGFA